MGLIMLTFIFKLALLSTSLCQESQDSLQTVVDLLFELQDMNSRVSSMLDSHKPNEGCEGIIESLSSLSLSIHSFKGDGTSLDHKLEESNAYIAECNRRLRHNAKQITDLKDRRCSENKHFTESLISMQTQMEESFSLREKSGAVLHAKKIEGDSEPDMDALFTSLDNSLTSEFTAAEQRELKIANDFVMWQMEVEKESAQMLDEIQRSQLIIAKLQRDKKRMAQFDQEYQLTLKDCSDTIDVFKQRCSALDLFVEEEIARRTSMDEAIQESLYIFETQFTELSQYVRDKTRPDISKNQQKLDDYLS